MTTVPAASWTVTNTKAQTEGAASETTLSEEERGGWQYVGIPGRKTEESENAEHWEEQGFGGER